MKIENNKVVSLSYELKTDSIEGTVIETVSKDDPLTFIYGVGELLPKFEEQLSGLQTGADFNFDLNIEDAYGEVNTEAIADIPKDAFQFNEQENEKILTVGNIIPMQDSNGNHLQGKIIEISEESVKMDFNHPLAGKHLFFSGKVTEIRDATEEEKVNGLNRGCGEDCDCGDDCECDEEHSSECGCGGHD